MADSTARARLNGFSFSRPPAEMAGWYGTPSEAGRRGSTAVREHPGRSGNGSRHHPPLSWYTVV